MAIVYDILVDLRLIVTVYSGHVTGDIYQNTYRTIDADARYAQGLDELNVTLPHTLIDITLDDIQAVSAVVAASNPDVEDGMLVAVVLPPGVPDWNATLYNDISQHAGSPERTESYAHLEDAVDALGRTSKLERIRQVVISLGG